VAIFAGSTWTLRRALVWAGLAVTLLALGSQVRRLLADPSVLPPADFAMYWASGRLNAAGDNPYDPDRLLSLEREAGRDLAEPFIMYGPPWTLTLVMPFGLMTSQTGRMAWLLFHFVVVLFCSDYLWRYYGGPPRLRWFAWVVGVSFGPALIMLRMDQIGSLILLGVVGFLHFEKRGRWGLAGVALALTALKPHLVYLFGAAVLLWSVDRRRWSVPLAGALAVVAATVIPLACNPHVLDQYRSALGGRPPSDWETPTLGTALRLVFGVDRSWLQYVPTVAGLAWFVPYWFRRRKAWDWAEQTPILLLVSFLTTFYGAWSHDNVVLLVPLMQAAVWVVSRPWQLGSYLAVAGYLICDALTLVLRNEFSFLWVSPVFLLGYLMLRARMRNEQTAPAGENVSSIPHSALRVPHSPE
jgi:hypothetical protein